VDDGGQPSLRAKRSNPSIHACGNLMPSHLKNAPTISQTQAIEPNAIMF
jgi:hypothetical protein